jgi:hypothetical protein
MVQQSNASERQGTALTGIPTVVDVQDGLLGILLVLKHDVDVAHQMVSQVVANVHVLNQTVGFLQLPINVGEETVKVLLQSLVGHGAAWAQKAV